MSLSGAKPSASTIRAAIDSIDRRNTEQMESISRTESLQAELCARLYDRTLSEQSRLQKQRVDAITKVNMLAMYAAYTTASSPESQAEE